MNTVVANLNIEVIKPTIGAIIHDIDLNALNEQTTQQIQQALLDHQVIFFRKQQLAPQAQADLARSFGSLHVHPIYPSIEDVPEVMVLDSWKQDLRDNELWHTDVTFSKTPPLGCVLQAIKIPPVGGDTLWSSNTAAFKGLPLELQQKLRGLTATHDIRKSFPLELQQKLRGLTATHDIRKSFPLERFAHNEEEREKLLQTFKRNPPVVHPVVRTHPVTGEPLLFVSEGFTTRINELSEQESEQLLDFLFEHATQEQFHLRWKWQDGDIAIWDNRCTQHKALFDYGDAHRIMHRATINGDVPFYKEEQQPELAEA
ncbi:taurine dioxygenase [Acinetobacter pittii]|uniref:taurine dioxygenase n=1 Tax=Acinetobacter pittii TaxID=48296 RepID=UPI000837D9CB|nr:taurine dioxygenase [Acinetobacter pittii]MCK0870047.1 taurine dioxygenase [Acinetobacter pittii]MCK0922302.1 taurine dioxygenase [Acinetobacter pittii]OCZ22816.1 taurine dioxygenase [Acinetobacter pittii]QRO95968.1 taurine dioxygenase [Acinetobacter pittii]